MHYDLKYIFVFLWALFLSNFYLILNNFVIDKIVNLFIFSYLFMVQLTNILFNLYNLFNIECNIFFLNILQQYFMALYKYYWRAILKNKRIMYIIWKSLSSFHFNFPSIHYLLKYCFVIRMVHSTRSFSLISTIRILNSIFASSLLYMAARSIFFRRY